MCQPLLEGSPPSRFSDESCDFVLTRARGEGIFGNPTFGPICLVTVHNVMKHTLHKGRGKYLGRINIQAGLRNIFGSTKHFLHIAKELPCSLWFKYEILTDRYSTAKKVHIHFQAKMDTCEFISWEGQSQGSVRWASVQEREPVSEYPSMIMEDSFLLSALILGKHHDPNPYPSASSTTPGFVTWSRRLWCTSLLQERRGRRRKKATGRNRLMCEACQQCCSDWSRGVCKILSILAAAVCDNHNWEKMKGKCQR